jgi:hypothetical protein
MKPLEVSCYAAAFHRNGISGRPFWSVSFVYADKDCVGHHLVGILTEDFEPSVNSPVPRRDGIDCFVIEEGISESNWRGDEFYPYLAAYVKSRITALAQGNVST